jgi:hypothetical protein
MSQYRKKPVVIDAVQTDGRWQTVEDWLQSLGYAPWEEADDDSSAMWENTDGSITIPTLEGEHRADVGDWIIRGVAGEFYPCKPDIFDATYEAVEPDKPREAT